MRQQNQWAPALLVWAGLLLTGQGCRPAAPALTMINRHKTGIISDGGPVRSVVYRERTGLVRIVDTSGRAALVSPLQVWGYRHAGGKTYRLYQGSFYEVLEQADVCVYTIQEFGEAAKDYYYFSRTPHGDILTLTRKNLQAAFHDEPCMLAFIARSRPSEWLAVQGAERAGGKGHMGIVNAFRGCTVAQTGM